MIEFLSSTLGIGISIYLAIGCFVIQLQDKGLATPFVSWILGVVLWLPIIVIGTILGIYEAFRRK